MIRNNFATTYSLLLIEDDADTREMIEETLREYNPAYRLDQARAGLEGLEKLVRNAYDLVLLDYDLPDIDGLEVLRRIVANGQPMPVVFVTGKGNEEVAVRAFRQGAADYVIKTIDYLTTLPLIV